MSDSDPESSYNQNVPFSQHTSNSIRPLPPPPNTSDTNSTSLSSQQLSTNKSMSTGFLDTNNNQHLTIDHTSLLNSSTNPSNRSNNSQISSCNSLTSPIYKSTDSHHSSTKNNISSNYGSFSNTISSFKDDLTQDNPYYPNSSPPKTPYDNSLPSTIHHEQSSLLNNKSSICSLQSTDFSHSSNLPLNSNNISRKISISDNEYLQPYPFQPDFSTSNKKSLKKYSASLSVIVSDFDSDSDSSEFLVKIPNRKLLADDQSDISNYFSIENTHDFYSSDSQDQTEINTFTTNSTTFPFQTPSNHPQHPLNYPKHYNHSSIKSSSYYYNNPNYVPASNSSNYDADTYFDYLNNIESTQHNINFSYDSYSKVSLNLILFSSITTLTLIIPSLHFCNFIPPILSPYLIFSLKSTYLYIFLPFMSIYLLLFYYLSRISSSKNVDFDSVQQMLVLNNEQASLQNNHNVPQSNPYCDNPSCSLKQLPPTLTPRPYPTNPKPITKYSKKYKPSKRTRTFGVSTISKPTQHYHTPPPPLPPPSHTAHQPIHPLCHNTNNNNNNNNNNSNSNSNSNYNYSYNHENAHPHHFYSYCSKCKNFIKLRDHHCRWLNTCIRASNYRLFLAFLVMSAIYVAVLVSANACLLLFAIFDFDDRRSGGGGGGGIGTSIGIGASYARGAGTTSVSVSYSVADTGSRCSYMTCLATVIVPHLLPILQKLHANFPSAISASLYWLAAVSAGTNSLIASFFAIYVFILVIFHTYLSIVRKSTIEVCYPK
ncbi:Palmitoyltransferase ERF2 [Smittium culicis]|uniref:Palmitoyltransferase n=1 Tax=Smittium culicis TaxID=133412 RepID=A0A1R1X987_9FUNG|nr:Palmitoyltransferase ERF2 [Smittium culicis]